MVWDINHVVLVGRLTKDPELTYTQSGAAVCRFSIAVNRSSGSSAENENAANFFNVVAWNKTAEICNEYLSKGRQVGIDGRLQQRKWEGQDGVKRNTVEIVANNVQFFGPGRQSAGQSERQQEQQMGVRSPETSEQSSAEPKAEASDPFLSELDDDEIPF